MKHSVGKIAAIILLGFTLFVAGCSVQGEGKGLITITPGSAVVNFGATKQFTVSPSNIAVTWSVNGVQGGNATATGSIDTNGIYAAPLGPVDTTENVTVKADDSSGSSGTAKVFLTTFKASTRITTNYAKGAGRADTYSAGQKSIAIYKDSNGNVNIYTVWADDSLGVSQVWFRKSSDGGNTFDDPVPVDNEGVFDDQFSPMVAVDGNGNVFIMWEDHGEGDADIFIKKYDSSGFGSSQKVNLDIGGFTDQDTTPSIAINSLGDIYVVWEHRYNTFDLYPDIYFAIGKDTGGVVTFSSRGTIAFSGRRPAIALDPAGIAYVVWEDLTGFPIQSPTHIMINRIEKDGTLGFDTPKQIDSSLTPFDHARYPAIAVDAAGNVYVVWQRATIPNPDFVGEIISTYDLDLAKINSNTLTVVSTTLSFPDNPYVGLNGGPAYPTIAADSSKIYIAWDDKRNETKDIYFAKSSNGATFTTSRIVNDETGTWHEKPSIAALDGKAYVIWTDYRNTSLVSSISPNDVFFAEE